MIGTVIALLSSSGITGVLVSMISRSKYRAEIGKMRAETTQLDLKNVQEVINIWKAAAEQLGEEVKALTKEVQELKAENKQLKAMFHRDFAKLERSISNQSNQ